MKTFKELGIQTETKSFIGDKIKIDRILNREIAVFDYKIEDSKYTDKCLFLQIELNGNKHVVFTGSKVLIDTIQKIPREAFPFKTTIVRENEHFEFT